MAAHRTLVLGLLIGVALVVGAVAVSPQLGLARRQNLAESPGVAPPTTGDPAGPLTAHTFRTIADAQTAMVVNIRSESRRQTQQLDDFFGFGGPNRAPRDEFSEGAGTGFLIDKAGLILTNNHVVAGATKIEVGLFAGTPGNEEGTLYEAEVVGRDPLTDSALIRIAKRPSFDLPVALLGDSNQVRPGDWVMAIGNPFNLSHTVTVGVISAKERPFRGVENRVQEMLQTDAAINPGNSGGPLLNVQGQVVGMNTAIASPSGGNVGIGFAVPINVIRELLPQLNKGKVTRGRLGVEITNIPPQAREQLGLSDRRGALVARVEPGSPAASAGLEPGDVVIEYQGKPVENSSQLVTMVADTAPGTEATIKVLRDRRPVTLTARVAELDLRDAAPPTGPTPGRR